MNPEVSPWMVIADKQRYSDLKRQHEQRELKNIIKAQYQKQLEDQINLQKQMKMRQKKQQKQWERNIINSSIENQQRIIQLEKMKAYNSNERQSRMDVQNEYFKAARKEREEYMEEQSKKMENQMHRQAQQKLRKQMEESQRKKKMILDNLKESIDNKQMRQKRNRQEDNEFQNKKLHENQALNQREQQYREDYLRKLKERALTIDYGSHDAFQKNHQKTLVQRKKEEWENEQQYVKRARQLDIYQDEYKRMKLGLEKQYRSQLQRQISNRQEKKAIESRKQLQNDQQTIQRYQNYSKSLEMSKREAEDKNKKDMLQYLQRQVQEKKKLSKQGYFMRDKELQLNIDLLQNSKGIIPGETYELDPARKRQLETVAKSMAYSPLRLEKNYLAERGKTILH